VLMSRYGKIDARRMINAVADSNVGGREGKFREILDPVVGGREREK